MDFLEASIFDPNDDAMSIRRLFMFQMFCEVKAPVNLERVSWCFFIDKEESFIHMKYIGEGNLKNGEICPKI